ncbi:APC family permease [Streptomyces sp. NBC_01538]|uniref:APC family permease n=1 Tax=Streptomyces sp. NBC_01538 TaxID=2903897 RepID=UPI00386A1680
MSTDRAPALTGSLGVGSIVFMVVAAAAPLTAVSGVVPLGILLGDGAAFPATFVICCVVLLLFAVGYSAMSRHVPQAGAFYTYVQEALGRTAGQGAAYLALATYSLVQLAVYGYLGVVADGLVRDYGGPALPWWLWACAAAAAVGVLGYRNIELSGKVLGVLLLGEVGIVLALDAVVTVRGGGPSGLSTAFLRPERIGSGSLGIGIVFAIASYLGFEATAVFRDEARDPERTIPRATYLSLLLIGGFYTLSSWAVVSAWGEAQAVEAAGADPSGMLITTITRCLGTAAGDVAQVLLLSSLFAALLSFHNVLARYGFTLGNSGLLPRVCGGRHERHGSPHAASLLQSASAVVLVAVCAASGLDPVTQVFAWMSGTATLGALLLMGLTCLSVIVFFRRTRLDSRLWQTLLAPGLGLLGLGSCLWLVTVNFPLLIGGSTALAVTIGAVPPVFFAIGALLSVVRSRRTEATAAAQPVPVPEAEAV